jgi:hypothetical protein
MMKSFFLETFIFVDFWCYEIQESDLKLSDQLFTVGFGFNVVQNSIIYKISRKLFGRNGV